MVEKQMNNDSKKYGGIFAEEKHYSFEQMIVLNTIDTEKNNITFWRKADVKSTLKKSVGIIIQYRKKYYVITTVNAVENSKKLTGIYGKNICTYNLKIEVLAYEFDIAILSIENNDMAPDPVAKKKRDFSSIVKPNDHLMFVTTDIIAIQTKNKGDNKREMKMVNYNLTVTEPNAYGLMHDIPLIHAINSECNKPTKLTGINGAAVINDKHKIIGMILSVNETDMTYTIISSFWLWRIFADCIVDKQEYYGINTIDHLIDYPKEKNISQEMITEAMKKLAISKNGELEFKEKAEHCKDKNIEYLGKPIVAIDDFNVSGEYLNIKNKLVPIRSYVMKKCNYENREVMLQVLSDKGIVSKTSIECVPLTSVISIPLKYDYDIKKSFINIDGFVFVECCEELLKQIAKNKNMIGAIIQLYNADSNRVILIDAITNAKNECIVNKHGLPFVNNKILIVESINDHKVESLDDLKLAIKKSNTIRLVGTDSTNLTLQFDQDRIKELE